MITKNIVVKGMSIEVLESSGSGDPIFLFHGNSSAANSFTTLLNSDIGKNHKLVSISLPYHGNSSPIQPSNSVISIAMLGDFAADVVNHYGNSRYVLVGQSLGGHALLERLWKFPGAAGLMLVSALPISKSTMEMAFKPDPSQGALFKCKLDAEETDKLARCFLHKNNEENIALIKANIEKTQIGFRSALGNSLAAGLIEDELEPLRNCKMPVVFLIGEEDKFINQSYCNFISNQVSGVSIYYFNDCGHALHLEDPVLFEKHLNNFVMPL